VVKVPDFETLEEAKEWLREHLKEGARCPCCTQLAKVYSRPVYGTMASHLINLYNLDKSSDERFFHVSAFCPKHPGDFAKLVYWELIEERPKDEDNTEKRTSGYWAITDRGKRFVRNQTTIMSHVKLYDSRVMGFEGKSVDIKTILGKKFDYEELMK